jgi:Arc/MetJ-type ribon-helix-helix transcriptional regulator
MKVSVSLPDEDIEFLDQYARSQGYESRSAVVHRAVRLLQTAELGKGYEEAWDEWSSSKTGDEWETTVGDGLAGS